MTMNLLPLLLRDKPFTLSQASSCGVSRYLLGKLISDGTVELIARGVYRMSTGDITEEDQYRAAMLRVGTPSAICLISALVHYSLTDTIPKKIWVMVPISKRTKYTDLKCLRTRSPKWRIGIEQMEGYSITTLERTIVDCLSYRTKIGTQIGIEALRKAIASKKTTLGRVFDMAKKLGRIHRIQPYLEALS